MHSRRSSGPTGCLHSLVLLINHVINPRTQALLRRPTIILIDEATASLDVATEAAVHGALRESLRGVSVLHIAHRLSTVVDSQRVIVMRDGATLPRQLLASRWAPRFLIRAYP